MTGSRTGRFLRTRSFVALLILLATLVVGMSTQSQTASAATPGSISGTVTDSTGAPVANVSVSAFGATIGSVSTVTTAADGTYTIPSLAADTYTVQFSSSASTLAGLYVGERAVTDANGNYTFANRTPNLGTEISGGSWYKVGFYATCAAGQPPTTHWNGGATSEASASSVDVSPAMATTGVNAKF